MMRLPLLFALLCLPISAMANSAATVESAAQLCQGLKDCAVAWTAVAIRCKPGWTMVQEMPTWGGGDPKYLCAWVLEEPQK